jgi:proline iminopeptidase
VPQADVDGTFLWYEEVGTGPRCLVLHGGLGIDHHAYRPGLDVLSEDLTLVYYDHRAHGQSGDAPLHTLTIGRLADDADQLRAHVQPDQPIGVLGHSFGGFIAFELAHRHREHLAFLIIIGSAPTIAHDIDIERRLTPAMRDVLALPEPETDEEWARRGRILLPLYFHRWDERYIDALHAKVRHRYDAAIAAGSSLDGWDRTPDLTDMTIPTLIVVGDDDFIQRVEIARDTAERMPDATLAVIEGSGHYPWLEQPVELERRVTTWLRDREVI